MRAGFDYNSNTFQAAAALGTMTVCSLRHRAESRVVASGWDGSHAPEHRVRAISTHNTTTHTHTHINNNTPPSPNVT